MCLPRSNNTITSGKNTPSRLCSNRKVRHHTSHSLYKAGSRPRSRLPFAIYLLLPPCQHQVSFSFFFFSRLIATSTGQTHTQTFAQFLPKSNLQYPTQSSTVGVNPKWQANSSDPAIAI